MCSFLCAIGLQTIVVCFLNLAAGPNNSLIDCSACDSPRYHHGCFPILVPGNDQFYPRARAGRRCIKFLRSLPGQQRLGPREQLNQNTAFVDASQIYGQVNSRYSRRHSSMENR